MLASEIVRRLRAGETNPELLKAAADKLDDHLGVGFAAFQDGTFELFIQSEGGEWNHTGRWESEAQLEQMRKVFADCVIVRATRGVEPYALTDEVIAEFWPGSDPDEIRRQYDASIKALEELRR